MIGSDAGTGYSAARIEMETKVHEVFKITHGASASSWEGDIKLGHQSKDHKGLGGYDKNLR